jgi:hypothetical protein
MFLNQSEQTNRPNDMQNIRRTNTQNIIDELSKKFNKE